MKEGITQSDVDLKEIYFATDCLFDEITFVKSQEYHEDFYDAYLITDSMRERRDKEGYMEQEIELQQFFMELYKEKPGFYQVGDDFCFIKYENVLCYELTYKLDNKYIAKVHVACVKGEKPKITAALIK